MAVIRNLVVKVTADIGSLKKGLQEAQDTMSIVGKQLSGVGKTMSAALTLPLAGMAAASLKAGADFEAGMSSVKAVSGATGDEMKQLEDLALKMGAETKYSAKEAVSGIEELIKAGVSVKDIMGGGLKGALSLAAAGELELADAAEIAGLLQSSMKDLTDAQRLQSMETLFGSDAIRAANILYKEGADGWGCPCN
jgi:hypothetical protein